MKKKNSKIEIKQEAVDPKFLKLYETFEKFQPSSSNKKPLIEVTDLTKSFRNNFKQEEVLKGVNLTIYQDDKIALLGGNGVGKTTLIEIISGVEQLTSGKIEYLFDYEITPQERIGIQFQDSTCPYGLTVYDLISLQNSIIKHKLSDNEITNLVDFFKLKDILKVNSAKLPRGQQQLVNIALSIMCNPVVLFLDELSTGLDLGTQVYINEAIKKYVEENHVSLVLSSHNVNEVLFHTNRCILMKDGNIVVDVPTKAIVKHFKDFEFFLTNFIKM